jgi:CubicO group peptidase (beta-lactamase class C family)
LGDGGIYSSIDDLEKWDTALADHSLLSAEEFQPAVTPVLLAGGQLPNGPDGRPLAYGFAWLLDPYHGHRTMSHRGGSTGFHTDIERFPDDKLTIIVLCNRTDIQPRDLAHKVADLYFDSGSGMITFAPGSAASHIRAASAPEAPVTIWTVSTGRRCISAIASRRLSAPAGRL